VYEYETNRDARKGRREDMQSYRGVPEAKKYGKKDGDRLRTQFHWGRDVTQSERAQQTRNIDESREREQEKVAAKSMKGNYLKF